VVRKSQHLRIALCIYVANRDKPLIIIRDHTRLHTWKADTTSSVRYVIYKKQRGEELWGRQPYVHVLVQYTTRTELMHVQEQGDDHDFHHLLIRFLLTAIPPASSIEIRF